MAGKRLTPLRCVLAHSAATPKACARLHTHCIRERRLVMQNAQLWLLSRARPQAYPQVVNKDGTFCSDMSCASLFAIRASDAAARDKLEQEAEPLSKRLRTVRDGFSRISQHFRLSGGESLPPFASPRRPRSLLSVSRSVLAEAEAHALNRT